MKQFLQTHNLVKKYLIYYENWKMLRKKKSIFYPKTSGWIKKKINGDNNPKN